jgi:ABC-type transport system involved in multi-copper enzyme maturation permease subunit
MIRRLVLKDWHLMRWPIVTYLAGAAVALGLILVGTDASFFAALILLCTVALAAGIHLAIGSVIEERARGTLPFVMSLPVTPADYSIAKVTANVTIFLLIWGFLAVGMIGIFTLPGTPHGVIPWAAAILGILFAGYAFTFAAAMISESMVWTIGAMIVANFSLQATFYFVSNFTDIGKQVHSKAFVWTPTATAIVTGEMLAVVAFFALAMMVQSRKRDFI